MKISHTKDLPLVGVSHNPEIKKRVFVSRDEIPHLMMFDQAIFNPGQSVEKHFHETMSEVFYIQSGRAEFVVGDEKFVANAGDCVTIDPGELHSQSNPFDEDVIWLYFGIAIN